MDLSFSANEILIREVVMLHLHEQKKRTERQAYYAVRGGSHKWRNSNKNGAIQVDEAQIAP